MRLFFTYLVIALLVIGCKQESPSPAEDAFPETPFLIEQGEITYNGSPVTYNGVNALQTFGLSDSAIMNEWGIEIVREFIGNLREQPIEEDAILASDGNWYHGLQKIVDQNRANGKVTILCPFGWVNEAGEQTLFTGLNPSEQSFYSEYKTKMRAIASHFKDQPDVWIEVWNEPYSWNNQHGYTHSLWLSDMKDMVTNLRSVSGFYNVILVPGNEQGQAEDAILAEGNKLLNDQHNLLFDLHAYEKWLIDQSTEEITSRINALKSEGFAIVFGEVGVINASGLMQVDHFLTAAQTTNTSTLAWLWNKNSGDQNALLNDNGGANNNENNNWGNTFKNFLAQ
ncbi:cellulase family glycosylhydrolase [Roseivirga pacifica]|uniref:cellulase family glycosylhydrolase n=1 Tax=Roseivirga pacifica TaxID=1267423 RepID=UPI003BAE16EC